MVKQRVVPIIVATIAHGIAVPGTAQTTTPVTVGRCNACAIEARPLVHLGNDTDSVSLSEFETSVRMTSSGDYVVAMTSTPGEIAFFGLDGRLKRTFGRVGKAPGEIGNGPISIWITRSDTLSVFDYANGRRTIVSPEGRYVGSTPFAYPYGEAVILADGQIILNANLRSGNTVGLALHQITPQGNLVRSFSQSSQTMFRVGDLTYSRAMSVTDASMVWAAHNTAYRLELWDSAGHLVKSLERSVPWFAPYSTITPGEPFTVRPHPRITAVMQDNNGLLWVLMHVPDRNWRPVRFPTGHIKVTAKSLATARGLLDSVIEVIDLTTNTVIASRRDDDPFISFIAQHHAYRLGETEAGGRRIAIWQVTLNTSKGATL